MNCKKSKTYRIIQMFVLSFMMALVILSSSLFSQVSSASTNNYTDTDLLNCWRVSGTRYVYTPVSITTTVSVDFTVDYSSGRIYVSRWDLSGRVLNNTFTVLGGTLTVGNLNVRGVNHSLPNVSSYFSDPNYTVYGRNWTGTESYSSSSSSAYGQSIYIVDHTMGYQTNTTGQVDFSW